MPNPSNHMEEGYSYVQGYVRRTRRSSGRGPDPFSALFMLLLIGICIWAVIWFIKTFWIFLSIVLVVALIIFAIIKWRKWRLAFIFLGILGFIVCLSIFFTAKEPSATLVSAMKIDKFSDGSGIFGKTLTVQIEPTNVTKPDQLYLLELNNGITSVEYKASWNQLELDIHKILTFSTDASQDELTAWNAHPNFQASVRELNPSHNPLFILLGAAILAVFVAVGIYVIPKIFLEY